MRIHVQELTKMLEGEVAHLKAIQEQLENGKAATTKFVATTEESFKGATGDSTRAFLQEAYQPLQEKALMISTRFSELLTEFNADAIDKFGAYGILNEEYLEQEYLPSFSRFTREEVENAQEINQLIYEANEFFPFPNLNIYEIEEVDYEMRQEVTKIITQLHDFNTTWVNNFKEIHQMQDELDAMLDQLDDSKVSPMSYKAGTIAYMNAEQQALYNALPQEFKDAITSGFATIDDFQMTDDGFIICLVPLSKMLTLSSLSDAEDYNDQYLYCIKDKNGKYIYSTCKLRTGCEEGEQRIGVSISFVSLSAEEIKNIFDGKANQTIIDRSVYAQSSRYWEATADSTLIKYFSDPQSTGGYMLADIYIKKIISMQPQNKDSTSIGNYNGGSPLTDDNFKNMMMDSEYQLLINNPSYDKKSGSVKVKDINNLSADEYNAILLIHSGNIDSYSFNAEIKFHADYADSIIKPVKDSAIKSDMGIGESKNYGRFINLPPIYELNEERYKTKDGDLYQEQIDIHGK